MQYFTITQSFIYLHLYNYFTKATIPFFAFYLSHLKTVCVRQIVIEIYTAWVALKLYDF